METKVNYAVVGVFVLALGAALIAIVLWLAGGLESRKAYALYQSTVSESVSGLNMGAPVKYLGVTVGKVQTIQLDPVNPQQVELVFAIQEGTPIKQDTVAVLKTQGLTGIAYVELSGGAPDAPLLVANGKEPYPTIRSRPSLGTRLETVLTKTLANLDQTSASLNALLNEENRTSVKNILADTSTLMHTLVKQQDVITAGIHNAARTADNTARATQRLGPLLTRIGNSADSVEKMANEVSLAGTGARQTMNSLDIGIGKFTGETLPEMERLLSEIGVLAASVRRLSDQTERNPNSLLWGRPPVAPGPGEEVPAR